MWTFYELKTRAKEVLKTSYGKSLIAILICGLIGGGISLNANTASFAPTDYKSIETAISNNIGLFSGLFSSILVSSLLISFFITIPLTVGKVRFFNESARGNVSLKQVFYPFTNGVSNYLNIVKVSFFKSLFLFLWGIGGVLVAALLSFGISRVVPASEAYIILMLGLVYVGLIPMLVKTLEYYFVEYILSDEPGITWREALKKSKAMTSGNKLRILFLGLSFAGWILLGAMCFGVGVILVNPYIEATFTQLYFKLKDVYTQNEYEEI